MPADPAAGAKGNAPFCPWSVVSRKFLSQQRYHPQRQPQAKNLQFELLANAKNFEKRFLALQTILPVGGHPFLSVIHSRLGREL